MKKTILLFITILFSAAYSFSQNCVTDSENRTEITENIKENNFIAHIVVHRNRKRTFNATVSFISPKTLIGAGHSFRERWYTKIKKIELFIGQRNENGENIYTEKHVFTRDEIKLWVDPVFQKKGSPDFDFALVSLPKNIVSDFFKLNTFEKVKTKTETVNINGYPGDKGNKALWTKNTTVNNITEKENVLLHDMFTYTGDSGAPIWSKINNTYYLIGVHGTGHYRNGSCNAGIKLTDERISLIENFVKTNSVK